MGRHPVPLRPVLPQPTAAPPPPLGHPKPGQAEGVRRDYKRSAGCLFTEWGGFLVGPMVKGRVIFGLPAIM